MSDDTKTVVISGGTDGMGRALARARRARGDRVVVIGSSEEKGRALRDETGAGLEFLRADLTLVAENRRVLRYLTDHYRSIDALALFANRQSPRRRETAEGLESVFALYYLSRYLLAHGLRPQLASAPAPVIVSVAGVGATAGAVQWDDMQLTRRYGAVRSQLHAGRANDLLGVAYAESCGDTVPFVMYHPGFTRSGDLSPLNPLVRTMIRTLARFRARPVEASVAPILGFIDRPPAAALTAVDRGTTLDASFPTLDPVAARRLTAYTEDLLRNL
ncbi:SDR family NAD(P)-dependent oxidoreductase [Nocardia sp. NPDC024068]|uniref:SDR family NAD(P)-dependent oxidoreductase n=1 Tax=Nocardia sp. NPDC024068 TaxID=3157197 RepID=UPI0033CE0F37